MSLLDLPVAPSQKSRTRKHANRYSDEQIARAKAAVVFGVPAHVVAREAGVSVQSVWYWTGRYYKKSVAPDPQMAARLRAAIRGE